MAGSLLLSGCYMNVVTPTPNLSVRMVAETPARVGTATCTQVLWTFFFGDCSMKAAMADAGISKVHHVDANPKILFYGLYSTLTIKAYGE